MAYLARLRAGHAANLLLGSDQSIAAIGWPDQDYFRPALPERYGLSASMYQAHVSPPASATARLRSNTQGVTQAERADS